MAESKRTKQKTNDLPSQQDRLLSERDKKQRKTDGPNYASKY